MADVNASINIDINASSALAQLKALESQISNFNNSVARSNAAAMQVQRGMVSSLQAQIEATGNFNTSIRTMSSNLDSLSTAFDKGTLSSRQYFRYAASQMPGLTKAFRSLGVEQAQMAGLAEERVKKLQTRYVSLGKDINGMQRMLAIQPKTLASGYATDIALATQRQQLFNRALQLGTTGMVNWGKNTQWAGRQLMVGFTVPLTIAAGAAAKFFMDLDKAGVAFRRVYGDMGTSTAETEKNLEAIQKLGQEYTKYGLVVSDVIDLGARAAATGAMNEDLLAATEQTLRLATLGQTDYNTALDATISFQTAFQLNSQELAETINFLNAVENQTILTMEDMARAVPRVAPVIKGLGGDVADLAVFMTALREGGVTAEQGANALKSGLASLINPTERASETLKEMGINIKEIVNANRGDLMGTVKAFGEALNTLGEFERQQALEATFGKYQYARLGALFKNIARDGSQAARSMDLAAMSVEDLASLADKELSTVSESVTNKFLGAVERLKVAIAPIGEMFLQAMTPIIEVVTNIANKFNELPDTVKTVIAGIVGAVGLIAPAVLMGIGLIANGIGNGLKFILALRGGIRGLVGVLTGSTQSFQYQSNAALDAAAAMSALDGSSGALTSSLLMQEGAVNSLIGAYGNLAGAARAAASSMPRAFPAPVMAGGARVVRRAMGGIIPGTGNTDSVPALLTPGEFVMTKQATEQFGPVLAAMNAGAVEGFQRGGSVGSQSGRSRALQLEFAHVMDRFELTIDEITGTMGKLADSGQKASGAYKELERVVKTGADPGRPGFYKERAFGYGNLGVMLPGDINNLLGQRGGAGAARGNVSSAVRSMGAGTASGLIDLLAQKGTILDPADEKKFADAFYRNFADEIDRLPDEMLKDANLEQPFRAAATKAASEVNDKFVQTVRSTIDESAREMTAIVTESGQVRKGSGRKPIRRGVLSGATSFLSRRGQRSAIFQRVTGATMQNVAMQRAQQMGVEATESVATGAQTRSPSDATRAVGKDVGEGLVQGMNESAAEVKAAGENMGRAATGGVADAAKQGQLELFDEALSPNLAQDEQLSLFNEKDLAAANKEAVDERKKSNFAIRQNTDATQKQTLQVKESTTADALNTSATRKNTNLQVTKTQSGATMRPSISTSGAFTPAGTAVDNESAALAAALVDQEFETKAATKQTRGLKDRMTGVSRKMFGVSAAFTGLTIAGSFMGGQMGEVASSLMPVAFGMDAVAGLLPMMMNPVGIAIAAFAAVGGGLWFLNNQMNDVRARAQDFADSLTTSAAEVNKVAEYFGNETLNQREQLVNIAERAGVKSKDVAAGMEFIGSEVGQEMAKQFTMSLEREGGAQSATNFANKLASMMMQGAIDFGQAKQVAAGLAQQLGQPEISAQIIGHLERIVGPDGKDLAKNPLKIAAEITANEKQIVDGLVAPTTNAINTAMNQDFGDMAKTALINPLAGIVTQLGMDIPYITDISKNLMSFLDEDFEKATESVHTYGKAVGNGLRNAYDNLNSAIIRNDEIIKNAKKKDRPDLREKAIREEARLRQDIAKIQEGAEQSFGKLVQQNAALSKEALDGMQVSLKEMYQDPTMQLYLDNLFARTGGLDQQVQFDVLMSLQSGQLNPMAANSLFDLIGNDEQAATTLNMLVDTKGVTDTNEFLLKLMQIGDEEIRKKLLIQYTAEGSPEDAAILAGFTPEAEQGLKSTAEEAREEYQTALAEYNTVGFDSQGRQTRGGRFRLLNQEDAQAELERLRSYYDTANSDLAKFYSDREAIALSGNKLLPGLENVPSQLYGPQDEVFGASAQTVASYEMALESLAAIDVRPKIKLDGAKTSEQELSRVTKAFEEYLTLPEESQKLIDINTLQATEGLDKFRVNWEEIDGLKDLKKTLGLNDSFSETFRAFGFNYQAFSSLPDLVKRAIMQYITVYDVYRGTQGRAIASANAAAASTSQYAGYDYAQSNSLAAQSNLAAQEAQSAAEGLYNQNVSGGGEGASVPQTQTPGGSGGSGGGGAAEKSGADLIKEMIDGLKEQLKFLGDYKKVGDEVKSGLAQALRNAGAPEQLIADIISKGAEGIKMAKELLKDKAKKLKEVTDLMLEVTRLTFVETQRAEAANLAAQTNAQMALANSGISPEIIANLDPQQAQAISDAYSAYQAAQRKADAAKDKSTKKQKQANKDLAQAKKAWEQVTSAINQNTTAQINNLIAQARLERQTAQNQIAASLTLAGRGFGGEQIAEIFEAAPEAANQIVAYTNKIKQLSDERKKLQDKVKKDTATKEERKRYRELGQQLEKVRGDYNALIRTLQRLSKEQARADVANTIVGMGARAVGARRQRAAQNLLMGQGLTFDQAESVAGDEDTARAVVGANRQVTRSTDKVSAAERAKDKYLAEGGKRRGKEWERLKAAIASARKELAAAQKDQDSLNASIAGMLTEESALEWQSVQAGINAEIARQQNTQKFINLGIKDQLVLNRLNNLTLEQQNYFLSLSKEQQDAFVSSLQASIPLAEKLANAFDRISAAQQLQTLLNEEATNKQMGKTLEQYDEALDLLQDQVRAQQDLLDVQQDKIDLIEEENEDLNRGLELLSRQEEAINEAFDNRIDALDKVEQANARIAQQQQNQLNLSQALAQGDIYAATQAAQQTRQDNATAAIENTRDALELAREEQLKNLAVEVNGKLLTRDQIEKEILANNDEIYQIQEDQIEPIEKVIDGLNKQIDTTNRLKESWQDYYKFLQDNAVDPTTGLKYKDLNRLKEIYDAIFAAQEVKDAGLALQQAMNTTGIKTTPTQFYQAFGITPTNPVTGNPGAWESFSPAYQAASAADKAFIDKLFGNKPPTKATFDALAAERRSALVNALSGGLTADEKKQLESAFGSATGTGTGAEGTTTADINAGKEAAVAALPEVVKVRDAAKAIKKTIVEIPAEIIKLTRSVIDNAQPAIDEAKEKTHGVLKKFKAIGTNIVNELIPNALTPFKQFLEGGLLTAANSVLDAFKSINSQITRAINSVAALATSLANLQRNIVINIVVNTTYTSSGSPGGDASKPKKFAGGLIKMATGGVVPGGIPRDSVPILASPGEFVVRNAMVDKYGPSMLSAINQGSFEPSFRTPSMVTYTKINRSMQADNSRTMYNNNYSINVTANTNANADEIASATVMKIRQMNSMQIRGARG